MQEGLEPAAEHFDRATPEHLLCRRVEHDDALVLVQREDRVHRGLDDGSRLGPAHLQCELELPLLGHVGQDDLALGRTAPRRLRSGLEPDERLHAVAAQEPYFTRLPHPRREDRAQVLCEPGPIGRCDEGRQRPPHQLRARQIEERAGRDVGIPDRPAAIEAQPSEWRQVIELAVSVARCAQPDLRPPELRVLHLELDLIHLKLVVQALSSRGRRAGRRRGRATEESLGAAA